MRSATCAARITRFKCINQSFLFALVLCASVGPKAFISNRPVEHSSSATFINWLWIFIVVCRRPLVIVVIAVSVRRQHLPVHSTPFFSLRCFRIIHIQFAQGQLSLPSAMQNFLDSNKWPATAKNINFNFNWNRFYSFARDQSAKVYEITNWSSQYERTWQRIKRKRKAPTKRRLDGKKRDRERSVKCKTLACETTVFPPNELNWM